MNTEKLTTADIRRGAEIIRAGGLLALPTETVYGLGADGLNPEAVRQIFLAKGRPQNNPLILHIPDAGWLERYCYDIPAAAYTLAAAFWPGPLTMILKARDCVPRVTTGGLDTVGMRCPQHPATRAVIQTAGVPISAPSANTSGRPSCTTAQDVWEDMNGKIQGIMDGGPCAVGVESTILDLTVDPPCLLRPGGLPLEEIEAVLGVSVPIDRAVTAQMKPGERPRAPGMAYRHYAPQAPVTVVEGEPALAAAYIRRRCGEHTGVICFDEFADLFSGLEVQRLGGVADKDTQARRVFDALRYFDSTDVTEIFAQCPDPSGLGLAIGNRIKKAAGFHTITISGERDMKLIGITGPTGAGKTTALRELTALGAEIIDADAVYHELLSSSRELNSALKARFPSAYRGETLDRKALGNIVFHDESALADLDGIILRYVNAETDRRIEAARESGLPGVGIDAINLIGSGIDERCDATVAIVAPDELRVSRIMARDGISEEYARSRINAQKPCSFYAAHCGFVLENDGDEAAFAQQARELFTALLK
ncbi:MAG: threonylcarbamoyl-AMP synthase [Oscillospiraceae bacterium]|nr:threonylcarbamoyl-AMP synthase [Oscillospiraceae bacterium]